MLARMSQTAHTVQAMASSRIRPTGNLRGALIFAAGLAVVLIIAWLAYRPGLSGTFLFDDFGNLPAIGASGPVDNWATFWRYITSGTADPIKPAIRVYTRCSVTASVTRPPSLSLSGTGS